jgi:hypothetical protein
MVSVRRMDQVNSAILTDLDAYITCIHWRSTSCRFQHKLYRSLENYASCKLKLSALPKKVTLSPRYLRIQRLVEFSAAWVTDVLRECYTEAYEHGIACQESTDPSSVLKRTERTHHFGPPRRLGESC